MAQGLLQQRLKELESQLQDPVDVESAGIFAIDGMSPSRETVKLLLQEGVDLSGHMARSVSDQMIREADLVLVMELFHQEEILRRVPDAKGKVFLLKTCGQANPVPPDDPGIPDPIGKPAEVYEVCFATIKEAIARVANQLVSTQKGP